MDSCLLTLPIVKKVTLSKLSQAYVSLFYIIFYFAEPMNQIKPSQHILPSLFLTKGELDVLALMAAKGVTIRQIKDAVQALKTTDMELVSSVLNDINN